MPLASFLVVFGHAVRISGVYKGECYTMMPYAVYVITECLTFVCP